MIDIRDEGSRTMIYEGQIPYSQLRSKRLPLDSDKYVSVQVQELESDLFMQIQLNFRLTASSDFCELKFQFLEFSEIHP